VLNRTGWKKTSRQSRGYDAVWDRTRKRILERDCYMCKCAHCQAEGRVLAASQVDHVVSKANARARGWTEEQIESDDNLAAINYECHKRKTAEELGRTYSPPRKIGDDGFPIDLPR
jgi:5-methylcytosine-specific restriction protein A